MQIKVYANTMLMWANRVTKLGPQQCPYQHSRPSAGHTTLLLMQTILFPLMSSPSTGGRDCPPQ